MDKSHTRNQKVWHILRNCFALATSTFFGKNIVTEKMISGFGQLKDNFQKF